MFIGNSTTLSAGASRPFLSVWLQWTVRVLAWLAFFISSYLAYKSIGHDVSAGCITGSPDCAIVQSSSWSVWLGLPVAIAGLACYSALAGLSVLTGVTNPRFASWISTLLTMLALVAAVSGLWFTAIQFFVLQTICFECMAIHACGMAIAAILLWAVFGDRPRTPIARSAPAGLMALRAATPVASRGTAPVAATPVAVRATPALSPQPARPSLRIALAGASAVLIALVGGQLLFPADGAVQGQVALDKSFHLEGAADDGSDSTNADADGKQPYEVNKIATGDSGTESGVKTASGIQQDINDGGNESPSTVSDKRPVVHAVAEIGLPKKRIVKVLDGKVSLDVYRHPVLGSPEAPHIILEFVSYDCPHCHHMAKTVRRALDRYGSQVAVVVLVIPAGIECNKEITDASHSNPGACSTARMALSVAHLEPEKFGKFHDWLMESKDKAPSPAQVVQKAYNAVGRERIQKLRQEESTKDDFVKQVGQNIDLYNAVAAVIVAKGGKKPGLPLLVLGSQTHSGTPPNEEKFIDSWAEYLSLKAEPSTTTLVP